MPWAQCFHTMKKGLYDLEHFPDVGRAGSTRVAQVAGEEFHRILSTRTFGIDRMYAILSGIAPSTRSRYESGWKHWQLFMTTRNKSPWIIRSGPNWDGNLIDFLMFESKIIGNAAPTIRGEVSAIRFWHVVVGYPGFSIGGEISTSTQCVKARTSYSTQIACEPRYDGVAVWNVL